MMVATEDQTNNETTTEAEGVDETLGAPSNDDGIDAALDRYAESNAIEDEGETLADEAASADDGDPAGGEDGGTDDKAGGDAAGAADDAAENPEPDELRGARQALITAGIAVERIEKLAEDPETLRAFAKDLGWDPDAAADESGEVDEAGETDAAGSDNQPKDEDGKDQEQAKASERPTLEKINEVVRSKLTSDDFSDEEAEQIGAALAAVLELVPEPKTTDTGEASKELVDRLAASEQRQAVLERYIETQAIDAEMPKLKSVYPELDDQKAQERLFAAARELRQSGAKITGLPDLLRKAAVLEFGTAAHGRIEEQAAKDRKKRSHGQPAGANKTTKTTTINEDSDPADAAIDRWFQENNS
jgi:hypothetical protein